MYKGLYIKQTTCELFLLKKKPLQMPKCNTNIKTIADFANNNDNSNNNNTENDSPNIPITNNNNMNYNKLNATSVSSINNNNHNIPKCYHIPTFTNEQQANVLLNRIVQEFIPIIQHRNYNILSISELCCCSDGLDYSNTTNNKRRRKLHKVSNNIWGYNRTTWNHYNNNNNIKQHTIHIRLRHPTNHQLFLSYEDIAGTLAHELSHCVYGPHDTKFFKLMDTILDEHASIMSSKLASSSSLYNSNNDTNSNIPIPFSGTGQALGSASAPTTTTSNGPTSSSFNNVTDTGHVLGGDRTFIQFMTPKEVAVIAAETRRRQQQLRLRGDHCCRPCENDDVENNNNIDDDDDDDEDDTVNDDTYDVVEEEEKETKVMSGINENEQTVEHEPINNMKRPYQDSDQTTNDKMVSKRIPTLSTNTEGTSISDKNIICIDLTLDSDDDDTNDNANPNAKQILDQTWICHRCTYRNLSKSEVCDMCITTRV